jgi:beta-lactamase class A
LTGLSDQLSLTYVDLAKLMIWQSDNMAANILIATLGRERINASMAQFGLENTRLHMDCIDPDAVFGQLEALATTTPAEMAHLFAMLGREKILTPFPVGHT